MSITSLLKYFKIQKFNFDLFVYIGIMLFPLFFIAIPKTTTAAATLLSLCCFYLLLFRRNDFFKYSEILIISLAFLGYLLAIILNQLFLLKFNFSEYQQQGRLIFLFPVFLYVYNTKLDLNLLAKFIIPLTCILGSISSFYFFQAPLEQWGSRHTVQHIDPLNFGYLMLFLAFASFWVFIRWTSDWTLKLLCLVAFVCGIYLSIRSGSRTGWMAIPLVVFWMLVISGKLKSRICFYAIAALALSSMLLYFASEVAHSRIDETIKDFKYYTWSGNPTANDSSVGIRLSMIRMGLYCFTESPLFGFGVRDMYDILNTPAIRMYASDSVIKFSSSGFMHNEFITQLVQHGIFGGVAYLFILFSIFHIYKKLKNYNIKSPFSDVFIIYIIFAVIASLSTEILVVKPMILFFGFMFACYAGESLWKIHDKEHAVSA